MSDDELRALVEALPDAGGVLRTPRGYAVKARPDAGRAATLGTDLRGARRLGRRPGRPAAHGARAGLRRPAPRTPRRAPAGRSPARLRAPRRRARRLRRSTRWASTIPATTPVIVNRLHSTPWPTCVAIGPGHASATAQPTPKIRLPTTWRRRGASRRPGHRLAGQHGAHAGAAQQQQPERRGGDRGGEEEVEVGVVEQQRLAQDLGAAHPRPRQRHAEDDADETTGQRGCASRSAPR